MSIASMVRGTGPSGFGFGTTADQVTEGLDLSGKRYLVTGVNSGLGQETVRVLTARGAAVVGTCRTLSQAQVSCAAFGSLVEPAECELSEPASVRACARQLLTQGRPLDAIVCNAGIMALPKLTLKHGVELQFLTNHLGHFTLVTALLPLLTATGRVVLVSSGAHRAAPSGGIDFDNLDGKRGYSAWAAYGRSKLANLLFAKELAKRLGPSGQTANALHPGVVGTNLWRSASPLLALGLKLGGPLISKTIPQGAATQTYLAAHPGVAGNNGEYFSDCNVARPSKYAREPALATRLWEHSERWLLTVSG